MILLISFAKLNGNTNFSPVMINDRICFTLEEGNELLEIVRLYPINTQLIEKYKQKEKITRRKRILTSIISGIAGAVVGGVCVAVVSIKINNLIVSFD